MPAQLPYILLIDDDQDDLDILSALLEKSGIVTRSYNSGAKAHVYLGLISDVSSMPSLIIIDYNMPKVNGQQVLAELKNNRITQNIPIIIYSTFMSILLRMDLMKLGAYDCLTKPCNYGELTEQVEVFNNLVHSISENKHVA